MRTLLLLIPLVCGCATIRVDVTHRVLRDVGLDSLTISYNKDGVTLGLK